MPDIGDLENEIEVPEGAEDSVSMNQISFGDISTEEMER